MPFDGTIRRSGGQAKINASICEEHARARQRQAHMHVLKLLSKCPHQGLGSENAAGTAAVAFCWRDEHHTSRSPDPANAGAGTQKFRSFEPKNTKNENMPELRHDFEGEQRTRWSLFRLNKK